jgi:hypothetical protein
MQIWHETVGEFVEIGDFYSSSFLLEMHCPFWQNDPEPQLTVEHGSEYGDKCFATEIKYLKKE